MEDGFITKPKLKFEYKDEDGFNFYSLKSPLVYNYNGKTHTIDDKKFMFNLVSTPKLFRKSYKPNKKETFWPSIPHDHDYSNRFTERFKDDWKFITLTKVEQHRFLTLINNKRERFIQRIKYAFERWGLFSLVRLFGGSHKAKHKPKY